MGRVKATVCIILPSVTLHIVPPLPYKVMLGYSLNMISWLAGTEKVLRTLSKVMLASGR